MRRRLLFSGRILGATGAGIYGMMSSSSSHNKKHKHMKVFEQLKKQYSSRKFSGGSNEGWVEVEVVDPNDPWWAGKWEEYKNQNSVPPKKAEEAKSGLEGFQEVCYEEININGNGCNPVFYSPRKIRSGKSKYRILRYG